MANKVEALVKYSQQLEYDRKVKENAHKMLEMLKYLLPTFKGTKTFNDIEQLIKEATTI